MENTGELKMSHYALIKDKKLVSLEEGDEGKQKALDAFRANEIDAIQELKTLSDVGELVGQLNQEPDNWNKFKNWFKGMVHTSTDAINKETDKILDEVETHSPNLQIRVRACLDLAKKTGTDRLEELRSAFGKATGKETTEDVEEDIDIQHLEFKLADIESFVKDLGPGGNPSNLPQTDWLLEKLAKDLRRMHWAYNRLKGDAD